MVFWFRRTRLQNQIVWLCPTMFFLFYFFFFTFYFCTFTFFFLLCFIAYFDFFFTFTLNFPVLSVFVQTRYFYFWGRQIISRNHRRQTNNETPQIRYLRTAIFDPRQSQPGGSPLDMLVDVYLCLSCQLVLQIRK